MAKLVSSILHRSLCRTMVAADLASEELKRDDLILYESLANSTYMMIFSAQSAHESANFWPVHIPWYVLRTHVIGGKCRNTTYDLVLKEDCYAHSVLYSPTTNTVRPLTILTDTWCSAGQFVSDGSLVQTGGGYEGQQKVR